jgi:hypothetical protein
MGATVNSDPERIANVFFNSSPSDFALGIKRREEESRRCAVESASAS